MQLFIHAPGHPTWPAHSADMAEYLFGNRKAKVPVDGFEPRQVQGITVFAHPLSNIRTAKPKQRFHLRVMAVCPHPDCMKIVPAGRLAQHAKVHKGA